MANPEHVELAKQGANAVNKWLDEQRARDPNHYPYLDLSHADLRGLDLAGVNIVAAFTGADLRDADLHGSGIWESWLESADLRGTDLRDTPFCYSDMSDANLSRADLSNADLSGVSLFGAVFDGTKLTNATMDHAECGYTVFARTDLSSVVGLEHIEHYGPSSLDTYTLLRMHRERHKLFLRGCGISEAMLQNLPSIQCSETLWNDCFIMNDRADSAFAEQLFHDLQEAGVRCWHFSHFPNLRAQELQREVTNAIWAHSKLALVCSRRTLTTPYIKELVTELIQSEDDQRQNGWETEIIIPAVLDDYVFEDWKQPRKAQILSGNISDFRQSYSEGLDQLLNSLRITDLPHAHE